MSNVNSAMLVEIIQYSNNTLWYKNKVGNRYYANRTPILSIAGDRYEVFLDIECKEIQKCCVYVQDIVILEDNIQIETTYKIIKPKVKKYKLVIHNVRSGAFCISTEYFKHLADYAKNHCDPDYTPISIILESMIEVDE